MHNENIFLGDIGGVPTTMSQTSSTVQAPGYDGSGINPDLQAFEVVEKKEEVVVEEEEEKPQNNWIMYLGVGLMAYILLFKKK